MNVCQYCNKHFSTKSNLNVHIKKAKYCLDKRRSCVIEREYICEACNKGFTSKQNLNKHILSCIKYIQNTEQNKYKYMLDEKNIQIQKLELQVRDLQHVVSTMIV